MKAIVIDRNVGKSKETSGSSFSLYVNGRYVGHLQFDPQTHTIVLVGLMNEIEMRGDA